MSLFGSSGIRTVFDKNLLDIAFKVGVGVGKLYGNVVVGTDTRTSRDVMKHTVISGLLTAGARCSDAGITPTPTLAYITREYDAGVMVTASHNPPEYNGVKLFNPDGSSFDLIQQARIEEEILAKSYTAVCWDEIKTCDVYENAVGNHIANILPHFPEKLKIKVVVDAGCGAAAEVTPRLLQEMGCEVIQINCYNSGFFPREIEPLEDNLQDLCKAVKESGAACGIAHDGDADRMMAIDEKGRYIAGDVMLAIFARGLGAKDMVTTLDASMVIEEMGFKVRRTKIGDSWVSDELKRGGDFGGETSGAWIFPQISLCPDGIFAATQVAAIAAENSLADLVDAVPKYPLVRGSIVGKCLDFACLEENLAVMKPDTISNADGIRLSFADGWLLVRPSGTEPKIRLTAEAKTQDRAQQLYSEAVKAVKNSITGG